jgi:hypothetical protein
MIEYCTNMGFLGSASALKEETGCRSEDGDGGKESALRFTKIKHWLQMTA